MHAVYSTARASKRFARGCTHHHLHVFKVVQTMVQRSARFAVLQEYVTGLSTMDGRRSHLLNER